MVWDFDSEKSGPSSRTPRISAAGFDIDTGKYYGPNSFDAVGFDPDTGRPIRAANTYQPLSAPGVPVQGTGTGGDLSLPDGLKEAHPAAKVLWAVQNNLVPHLRGIPAIDESGRIHPAYARALDAEVAGGEPPAPTPDSQIWSSLLAPSEAEAASRATTDGRFQTDKMKRVQEDWSKDPVSDWFKEKWEGAKEAIGNMEREAGDWLRGDEGQAGETNNRTDDQDAKK